jgi:hypothetical protein
MRDDGKASLRDAPHRFARSRERLGTRDDRDAFTLARELAAGGEERLRRAGKGVALDPAADGSLREGDGGRRVAQLHPRLLGTARRVRGVRRGLERSTGLVVHDANMREPEAARKTRTSATTTFAMRCGYRPWFGAEGRGSRRGVGDERIAGGLGFFSGAGGSTGAGPGGPSARYLTQTPAACARE